MHDSAEHHAFELTTDRLRLRIPEASDLDAFVAIFGDPDVTRYLGDGSTRPPERVAFSIQRARDCWNERGFGPLTILRKDNDTIVGDCLLIPVARSGIDPADSSKRGPEIEIGYRLGAYAWGHGYATEAAACVLQWALGTDNGAPGLTHVIGVTHPDNIASQRVLEKIGLDRIGPTDAFYNQTTMLFEKHV